MDKTYKSKDIIQMAIQAKTKGIDLYLALAANSENYHVGKLFAEFAKDENRHKLELKKWMSSFKKEAMEEAYPGERALYLKALVDAGTFNCAAAEKEALEKTINEEKALAAGITFEKDFMLFLHDLRQHVKNADLETIDSLIDDEVQHIKEMFRLKEKLTGKK